MPASFERVDLERGADRELPAGVLPGLVQVVVEQGVRLLVLVQHAHLVALPERPLGDRGADAAAADDQYEHRRPVRSWRRATSVLMQHSSA